MPSIFVSRHNIYLNIRFTEEKEECNIHIRSLSLRGTNVMSLRYVHNTDILLIEMSEENCSQYTVKEN